MYKVEKTDIPYRYIVNGMKVYFKEATIGENAGKTYMIYPDIDKCFEIKKMNYKDKPRIMGNGFVRIPIEVEYNDKGKSYRETFAKMTRKSKFYINDDKKKYVGYTYDETWNGWECPLFTLDVLKEIIKDFELQRVRYVADEDAYYYWDECAEEEYELARGFDTPTPDGMLHLYDGGQGWIWDEYEE